jgi:hypothetical protein
MTFVDVSPNKMNYFTGNFDNPLIKDNVSRDFAMIFIETFKYFVWESKLRKILPNINRIVDEISRTIAIYMDSNRKFSDMVLNIPFFRR